MFFCLFVFLLLYFLIRESATSLVHIGMQGVEVWKGFFFFFIFFSFFFRFSFFFLFFHLRSVLCPSVIIFPFFSFFFLLFFLPFLSLSLFLGILCILKGIIYKSFCLLNVFLFLMQFSFQRVVMFLSWISFSKILCRLLTVSVFLTILIHIFATKIM